MVDRRRPIQAPPLVDKRTACSTCRVVYLESLDRPDDWVWLVDEGRWQCMPCRIEDVAPTLRPRETSAWYRWAKPGCLSDP